MYRQVYQKTNSWFGTACFQCESLRYFVGKAAIKMAEQKSEIDIVGRFAGIEQAHTLQSKKSRFLMKDLCLWLTNTRSVAGEPQVVKGETKWKATRGKMLPVRQSTYRI